MIPVQAAITAAVNALSAVDWTDEVGQAVTVDGTPGRLWTVAERAAQPIVYVSGGGSTFQTFGRDVRLVETPSILLTTIYTIGFDAMGQLDTAKLATAETVLETSLAKTRDAFAANGSLFSIGSAEKLERYDPKLILQGEYLAGILIQVPTAARI